MSVEPPGAVIRNLQALRGIAALMVVLYHTRTWEETPGLFDVLGDWGQAGVDIFFVISGFIMALTTSTKAVGPLAFLRNRAVRIIPIYWLYTALFAALILAFPALLSNSVFDPLHILSSLGLFAQTLYDFPILTVGWTLEFEALFYLVFAAALILPQVTGRLVLVMAVLGLAVALGGSAMLLEFAFGIGAALAYMHLPRIAPAVLFALGVVLLLSSIAFPDHLPRAIAWGLPAALIVYGAACLPPLVPSFAVTLGDASYSIYLVHVFTVKAAAEFLDGPLASIVGTLASIAAGYLSYVAIERPIIDFARRSRRRNGSTDPHIAPAMVEGPADRGSTGHDRGSPV